MFNFLTEFLNDSYFTQGVIKIYSNTISYSEGEAVAGTPTVRTVRGAKVLVPVNAKDLVDMGLGEYIGNEVFNLYVTAPLKFSNGTLLQKGDQIEYESNIYKLISNLNFKTHGFYAYTITKFKDTTLND